MTRLTLSIATAAYDRVLALRDGRVRIEGCDHELLHVGHEQMFLRGFHNSEYDVCELSMSSYMMSVARGDNDYVAVPVFLSRLFRHSAIYINNDAGIMRPEDLAGRRIGVPEYQMTAALWVRGLLDDEYGVHPRDIHWLQGGVHEPGRVEKLPLSLPSEIRLEAIGSTQTLDDMLCRGEIDALVWARAPNSYRAGDDRVSRLFEDYRSVEQAYYRKTRLFPIMHVVGIKRQLFQERPWIANAIYDAFCKAKDAAVESFRDLSALRVTLPWFGAELDETRVLMGDDFWPYGVERNRDVLQHMVDYAYRHGTVDRALTVDELFAPSTLEDCKI